MVNRRKESDASMQLRSMVEAYELVIADVAQDVGWRERVKKRLLRSLEHRLWELHDIWDDVLDAEQDAK
jgi:hypothetical protein